MRDKPKKQRGRWLKWVGALCVLLLAVLLLVPFMLTTPLVRLALGQVFAGGRLSVARATLSPSGTLVLYDLVLRDTGALAARPLVTARQVDATFDWAALLSRQMRRIHAAGVTVYARSNGPSPLSLLDLWVEHSPSDPTTAAKRRVPPIWIDTVDVQGLIRLEPILGLVSASAEWPLALHMTTSGNRTDPAHQLRMAIGETRQLPQESPAQLAVAAPEPVPRAEVAFGLALEVEMQPVAGGRHLVVHRLATSQIDLAIKAESLRQHFPTLPAGLQGHIETSLRSLWASGVLHLQRPVSAQQLVGDLTFTGLRLRLPGRSSAILSVDDLTGTVKIETPVPPGPRTTVTIERLQVRNTKAAIDADTLRRYITELPAALRGTLDTDLAMLDVSGLIGSGMEADMGLSGHFRLQDLSVRTAAGDTTPAWALDHLTATGSVQSPLSPWTPAALTVRDGTLQWATLQYQNEVLRHLDMTWRLDGQQLWIERAMGEIFNGHVSGTLAWDLGTHAIPQCDVQLKSINMHAALANVSPEHFDAEGSASGFLRAMRSAEGELSGRLDLAFDGPGLLRIGEIDQVKQMLVGNVGLALASMALQDLQQYPFTEGRLSLESAGQNSELKIKFIRQPRSETNVTSPRKEIINGQEVWVGSLVVPVIDMTIPIIGKSLGEMLALISGVRPRREAVSQPNGK